MSIEPIANDNGFREKGGFNPDNLYVEEYLEKLLAHFRECNIDPSAVTLGLTAALLKYVPGNPKTRLPDESEIWGGLTCLWPAKHEITARIGAYEQALKRVWENRRKKKRPIWSAIRQKIHG